jgi:hypothetical protein
MTISKKGRGIRDAEKKVSDASNIAVFSLSTPA